MNKLIRTLKRSWLWKQARKLLKPSKIHPFEDSGSYWETRYQNKDNSGSGSYGRLADYKAEVLNAFVEAEGIDRVIEFGVGDGNQLALANYPEYVGFDVAPTAIAQCRKRFRSDGTKTFYSLDEVDVSEFRAPLVLSLDVIFHLVEDEVFEQYMQDLFRCATEHVVIYSSNHEEPIAQHVRSRKFTDWIEQNATGWTLDRVEKNRYPFDPMDPDRTSISDFFFFKRIS